MKDKYYLYIAVFIMFLMPIITVEDIIIWIIALYFIHKTIKTYKEKGKIKPIIINTLICGGIVFLYNFMVSNIEQILVKLWL